KAQHPNIFGCQFLNDRSKRYMELYIRKEDDKNDLLHSGVSFSKLNLRILPCTALDSALQNINISLTHLPMVHPSEIVKGLTLRLAPFGTVIDVGITTEPATGVFMGSGYSVLGRNSSGSTYQDLAHTISWCESKEDFFYCT
ncbi:hypothetical protein EDC96DRAFT_453971, partial [Choanephora cucurbitarum]